MHSNLHLWPITASPRLQLVDDRIFTATFYGDCMGCGFCRDGCCQHGCDVDVAERDRILAVKGALAPWVRAPPDRWFSTEEFPDPEYASGRYVRALKDGDRCVFHNREGRGCNLHRLAVAQGSDYHQLKPMACWLFPVCFDKGVLRPNSDVEDDLICTGEGRSLYAAARGEIGVLFGAALVAELDAIRDQVAARRGGARVGG